MYSSNENGVRAVCPPGYQPKKGGEPEFCVCGDHLKRGQAFVRHEGKILHPLCAPIKKEDEN